MKNINKKDNAPNTLRKTVVLFIILLFVISSVMTIENVNSTKDNELEVRLNFIELSGENWWNSSFEYRKLITINHSQVDENLSNFPILVYRNADANLSSHAQADGDDIVFVLYSDNSTKLNHEIENYSNGTLWAWVNVPYLSSSDDTILYLYYGNNSCSNQEDVIATWNSDYLMVHHMNDAGNISDSTANGHDGTNNGTTADIGQIDGCRYFDNTSDQYDFGNNTALNPGMDSWTISLWTKMVHVNNVNMLSKYASSSGFFLSMYDTNYLFVGDGTQITFRYWDIAWSDGQWHLITMVINRNTNLVDLYIDGVLHNGWGGGNITGFGSITTSANLLLYGGTDGRWDEFRVETTVRDSSWLWTCYNNQFDPSLFLTVGSEEESNKPPHMPSNPYPVNGSTSVNINVDLSWTGGDPDGDPVTYDVYFGTNTSPSHVVNNQSANAFSPGQLEYSTIYYWKIIAWDSFDAFTEGPLWHFTSEGEPEPDLDCVGSLSWTDVSPEATVTGSFTVENIGEPGSLLDWEIDDYPNWGYWTFTPSSGDDLLPNNPVTVGVTVIAPNQQNEEFTGEVKIVNKENSSDFCTIPVSLATPVSVNYQFNLHPLMQKILELFPNAFPILRYMLGI